MRTDRFILRSFAEHDLDQVYMALSDPEVIRYYGISYQTREAANAQMSFFADLEKNETGIWWAVCSSDMKLFLGACGFNGLRKEHRKAEIGYWLLPKYWRMGIMSEVLPMVCRYGFDQLGLHRIEAYIESENLSSKKLMKKLDFEYEGTLKENEIKNGKFISLEVYAKLNAGDRPQ